MLSEGVTTGLNRRLSHPFTTLLRDGKVRMKTGAILLTHSPLTTHHSPTHPSPLPPHIFSGISIPIIPIAVCSTCATMRLSFRRKALAASLSARRME